MRTPTAAALAAGTVLGTCAAAVAAGRYAAGRALRPARADGAAVPPGFGEPLTVHARLAARPERVALTRSLTAELPGTYGLTGRGVRAVVGHTMREATHAAPADTVVRRLLGVTRGTLTTGATVRLTPVVHSGDPGGALDLPYTDTEIASELGPLPAWAVPGDRGVWVVAAHGLGTTREQAMNVLPALARLRLPVLVPAHRGDPGAPRNPDGVGHLGASEWRDLDAAVRHALDQGASRVILYGWSTGATMALHVAAESAVRDRVCGLVLDSPVLDPAATLRALAAARGVPRPLLPLAVRAAEGRAGVRPEPPAVAASPERLEVPVLIAHGPGDEVAPWGASRALADSRPDLITLHVVGRAQHAAMWNADRDGYEEALTRFLMPLL
ncbi:alpha/beta fold hydrolase [Streptomyces sp. DSM 42041]|uniref:Alpha/beta fold hydrolase n=1 Tax=Streptomyces hazeniae TaxID=3075538 RepID=A0ABU2NY66_9ACTN|nr:alpha/beta fold hydrolase [Streptomyces sp. DSM 42041]MDT0381679.1 alpha/beta fold hydrolase [Streptomyces sp. DSM 42041]